jgi:hypothetical protein
LKHEVDEDQLKVWKDMIDWLVQQDGFVIVGLKDGEVNAKSSVELDDGYEMLSMVCEMMEQSLSEVAVAKVVQ